MRQKADLHFEHLSQQQLEFDQILKQEPDDAENSDDEFSSLPASVDHDHANTQQQEDSDNSPDKYQHAESRNYIEDNLDRLFRPKEREQELKRTFDDFFSREDPIEDFAEDADSASEGSEDDLQFIQER